MARLLWRGECAKIGKLCVSGLERRRVVMVSQFKPPQSAFGELCQFSYGISSEKVFHEKKSREKFRRRLLIPRIKWRRWMQPALECLELLKSEQDIIEKGSRRNQGDPFD